MAGVAAARYTQSVIRVDAGAPDCPTRELLLLPNDAPQNLVLNPQSTKEKRSKINRRMNEEQEVPMEEV